MTIPPPDSQPDHDQIDHDGRADPETAGAAGTGGEHPAPQTGHQEIDSALDDLGDLDSTPLDHHHDRLASAHETLHRALHPDQGDQA